MRRRSSRPGDRWLAGPAAALVVLALAGPSPAGVIASDDASDPAYANGWQGLKGAVASETGSDNGGSGFLAWNFDDTFWDATTSPYPEPHFIDTKPSSFNQLGAPAFALTNANVPFYGYTTTATRPFAAALAVGDQISVDVDNPVMHLLAPLDSCGFLIQLLTDKKVDRFGLYTTKDFDNDQWTITDSRGDQTPSQFTDVAGSSGFRFAFKLTGEDDYQLTLTPLGGQPRTFTGHLAHPGAGAVKSIQFVMYGNGSGDGHARATGEREFYFNHLTIESGEIPPVTLQKPSDCNQDGRLDISDGICLLFILFAGGTNIPCGGDLQGAGTVSVLDANGDHSVDISDAIWTLGYLFTGSAPPALGQNCQSIAGCPDNGAKCAD
jgi:hypothetical protein